MHRCLNIAGIELYPWLESYLPRCWSMPSLGTALRRHLEPPLLQQAAFDDTVFKMDVMRNVGIRESADDEPKSKEGKERKASLPVCIIVLLLAFIINIIK